MCEVIAMAIAVWDGRRWGVGVPRLYRALSQRVKEKAHSIFTVNKIIENYIVGSFISILIFVFSNFVFFSVLTFRISRFADWLAENSYFVLH